MRRIINRENLLNMSDFDAEVKETIANIKHELYDCGDAVHELDNTWVRIDPVEMTIELEKRNCILIGFFYLPGLNLRYNLIDIGLVIEDRETHNRYWCHANSKWFKTRRWEMLV